MPDFAHELTIINQNACRGITPIDGKTNFIEGALPGETVTFIDLVINNLKWITANVDLPMHQCVIDRHKTYFV